MLFSILIPVYNEEKTIAKILSKVVASPLPKGVRKEVIIVDDGSADRTLSILESELRKHKQKNGIDFRVIKHPHNSGKGAAIRTAISHAKGDVQIIQDADLEYDPQDYQILLEPILNKKTKVVYGTRLKNYPLRLWGENKTVLPSHWVANKALTHLTNLLYGSRLTDMETCFKLFSKDVIEDFKLEANKFDFEPEITAKILLGGYSIHEVPIKTTPRTHKEGKKIKWHDGIAAVWTLFKYRFKL